MAKKVTLTSNQQLQLERVGKRLRKLRIEKGRTNYEYLAYDIGIARTQLGGYERGQNITIATLVKILDYLDVTLEEFFAMDPDN